jgi:hypothetical protein
MHAAVILVRPFRFHRGYTAESTSFKRLETKRLGMVPGDGIEPPTPAFSGPRSTSELPRHGVNKDSKASERWRQRGRRSPVEFPLAAPQRNGSRNRRGGVTPPFRNERTQLFYRAAGGMPRSFNSTARSMYTSSRL